MRPYGIDRVGPICKYGCCFAQNPVSGFKKQLGHGKACKKRERREARDEIRASLEESVKVITES